MGILDGNMPLIVPVLQSPQQQQAGMKYADNFLTSYENAKSRTEQARQFDISQQERVREFDLSAPLREAQASHYQKQNSMLDAQLKSMTFQNDTEAQAAQARAKIGRAHV